jgi:DNA-binding beta-propeller fold protein YncE
MPRRLPALALAGGVIAALVVLPTVPASAFQPVVPLPGYRSTDQVAVDSPLHRVFVLGDDDARPGGRLLATIDARTDTLVTDPVAVAGGDFVAVDPVSHRVVLTDTDAGTLTILDGRTGATIAVSASLGLHIGQVEVDPYASRLYVLNDRHQLLTLDENGAAVGTGIPVPRSGFRLAVDFTRQKVYVPTDDRRVAVVDLEAGRVVSDIALGEVPGDVVVDPLDGKLLVSVPSAVITVDTGTDTVVGRRPMPTDAGRRLGVDIVAHTFLVRESDTAVVTITRGTANRLAVDAFGAMAVDYLLHKVYAAFADRPWVSVVHL